MQAIDYQDSLREVSTDAGVLRYHEAGDGPPLLMLHGSGPGVTGWRNYRGNLAFFAQHFRCLVLEFPGFGVSDDFGGHPMLDAQKAAVVFADALGLDRVDIIGNSMGGGVGINFAINHPDRVRRLVAIGGIGTNIFGPGPSEGIRLLQEFTEDPTRARLVDWLNSMVYDPALVTDELIEERWALATDPETLESARRMYGKAAFAAMMEMMRNADFPLPWAIIPDRYDFHTWTWAVSFCVPEAVDCVQITAIPMPIAKAFEYRANAHLTDGRYTMTVDVPDGLRCGNVYYGPVIATRDVYTWDAQTLQGTLESSFAAGCDGAPAGTFTYPFSLVRL
ncbi:alpha/beta fold hydrolase [Mycolicibacterium goodii]|uniref:alpha/beta fold hydrolase n=1 Tax=Mycolicibacterium goodii TaxID=134601 RepID=UPI00256EA5C0|nr:alpha/beta fold hydrolase [Mycolicibacterium goodii]